MLNIGIAGIGYWGKNILRVANLLNNAKVKYVCDKDPKRIAQFKRKYPLIEFTKDYETILKDKEIEAVLISTPAVTHFGLAKKALEYNKDVFVEKPLAVNISDAQKLIKLAEGKNKIIMVGHILQYHPAVLKLKSIISKGELGKIQYIYSNRLNIGKLRTEEDILWSFAPHDISVILMLLGDEPLNISAFAGDYLNKGVYDTTLTVMKFKNEIKSHIFVSWLHPYKEQRLIVVGTKRMAVFDDVTKEKLFIYPHKIQWLNNRIPVARKAEHYILKVEEKEPLEEELKHFVDCVRYRKKPRTDGYEALRVLKVLENAERTLRKG